MKVIIVQGGAGRWKREKMEEVKRGLFEAILSGFEILDRDGDAVDACEAAITVLEDNPIFNAGTGSVLTLDGRCEMDAAIMKGNNLEAGAVAGVTNIKNPIKLARKVMEETDHVLLAGEGAERFAKFMGFESYDPITERRRKEWKELRKKLAEGKSTRWPKISKLLKKHPELLTGTVGCVVLGKGEIVAGTSTGGVFLKLFGRVGDTPMLGAGTYATPFAGASATGIGEGIMRTLLAKTVCDFIRAGLSAQKAAEAGIDFVNHTVKLGAGIIAIDLSGNIGYAYNTECMPVAFMKEGMDSPSFAGFQDGTGKAER
jgi:beta-aspartyl-peptidase (threonine type)